jgi:hypothetical protein
MRHGPPRLIDLAIRLVVVGILLIAAARLLQTTLIQPLLPIFGATVSLLAPQFTLQSLDLVESRPPTLRLRANLLEPVEFAGRTVVPVGWLGTGPQGGYQVSLAMTGLLQYPTLTLLIVLAWPATGLKVLGVRVLLGIPMAALLLLTEAPTTMVAELWSIVRDQADPAATCYWMVLSRFLMGGGGLLIAGILGATAVVMAQRQRRAQVGPSAHPDKVDSCAFALGQDKVRRY